VSMLTAWPHQQCHQRVKRFPTKSSYELLPVVADERYHTLQSVTFLEGAKQVEALGIIVKTKSFYPFVITNLWVTNNTVRYRPLTTFRCRYLSSRRG
jgi:hypothetical protein